MALLDARYAQFVQGPVSVNASSRDAFNMPALARSNGCRVSAERSSVTLLFSRPRSAAFLAALAETRVIAAVFSRPKTHETIQLKGVDARLAPLQEGDLALARRHTEEFEEELTALGYEPQLVRGALWFAPQDLVAVEFSPCLAFDQTPGPRAGAPLPRRA